jgi:hypothetical protein
VEDEVALLVARLRAGSLERERLELAVHLGHGAARLALAELGAVVVRERFWTHARRVHAESELPGAIDDPDLAELGDWAFGLARWGHGAQLRVAVAAAAAALARFEAEHPDDPRPRRAVEAARAYARNPSRATAQAARGTVRPALSAARDVSQRDTMPGVDPIRDGPCAANQAAKLVQLIERERPANEKELALSERLLAWVASRAVRYAGGAVGCDQVRAAVAEEVVPWALA